MLPKKGGIFEEYRWMRPRFTKGVKITKGVKMLRNMAGRDAQNLECTRYRNRCNPGKSGQTISRHYCTMNQLNSFSHSNSFSSEMEELRKAFLTRPGCPQFSTRATSMSQVGSATMDDLSQETTSEKQDSDTGGVDERTLPFSKSACELNYLRRGSEALAPSPSPCSLVAVQSTQRRKTPWYISVIHEKDHSLLMLGEELQRLSELENQVQKKDEEILALQKEREALKRQLKNLLRSKGQETPVVSSSNKMDRFVDPKLARMSILKSMYKDDEDLQPWNQMQEEYSMPEHSRDLGSIQDEKVLAGEPKEIVITRARGSLGRIRAMQEDGSEEEQEESERIEEEEEEVVEEEEQQWELREEEERPRRMYSMTESFEEELMSQLEEYERMLVELQSELEITRSRYSLATGTITSLKRQVDFQESQLRNVNTENELLRKELRERKRQLQAMTDKFSNLHEEKKHQEMMGLIEKDNLALRQQVSDLETQLAKQELTITELSTKASSLQEQVSQAEDHVQRWKQLYEDLQSRNESIQQAEQQAQVALESSQSRLERLRNKVIQAAFNIGGNKNLNTEITDNLIIDALQKIISDRSDFYNQLKQKGVKVPPLQQSDISLASKVKKAVASK